MRNVVTIFSICIIVLLFSLPITIYAESDTIISVDFIGSNAIDLKKAHHQLDKEVEKLYRKEPFTSDQERIEFLLDEYQKMVEKNQTKLN